MSPSNYHWLNYNEQKLEARFFTWTSARRGTELHALAHDAIRLGVKLHRSNKSLATYVSDAIMYKMICEPTLYYSENCFGSPDTIAFNRRKLRIHDLKTGLTPTSIKQLIVYAALFCLENGISPHEIEIELRIYQGEEIRIYIPTPEEIEDVMETIVRHDRYLEELKLSYSY